MKLLELAESKDCIVGGPFGSNLKVSDYREKGIPIIRIQNVQRNHFDKKNIRYISDKKSKELSYHSYKHGDLVLAKLGTIIGKTCQIPHDFPNGIVTADVVRVRISPKRCHQKFLEYVLNSQICERQLNENRIGTTRPRVNLNDIRNLLIPLPPLEEQQKIASVFFNIDTLISNLQFELKYHQSIKKGLMQKILVNGIGHDDFKKIKTLFGKSYKIPKNWYQTTIGDHTTILVGYSFKSDKYSKNTNDVKLLRGDNVTEGILRWGNKTRYWKNASEFSKFNLMQGDFVVGMDGSKVGKNFAYVTQKDLPCLLLQRVACIRCKPILLQSYLGYVFSQNFLQYVNSVKTNFAIPHISNADIQNFELLLPPIDEQCKIVSILSNMDNLINNTQKEIEYVKIIKKGLMQKLLTGQIRVPLS